MLLLLLAGGAGALIMLVNRDDGTTTEVVAPTETETEDGTSSTTATTEPMPLEAEELALSVVQIQLLLDDRPVCSGSGTFIDTEGTILTNFHVVEQGPICPHDRIGIAIAPRSQSVPVLTYEADLLAFDSDLDLAVLRVARDLAGTPATETFQALEIGDSNDVQLGDQLRVIGFPGIGGETVTFTTGSVSGFTETEEAGERSWIKTDATITGGNSGGLAADGEGRIVGIPTRAGAGGGQIVDCRIITDSNGDGRTDGGDTCVPIGGFINGIRPVALALPLIEVADPAAPIDQGPPQRSEPMSMDVLPEVANAVWALDLDAEGRPVDPVVTVQAGVPKLCITWDYENVPTGSPFSAEWYADGSLIPEASITDGVTDGPESGSFYACIDSAAGLPAATFEFVWRVDGELVFGDAVFVGSGELAEIEVVNATPVPLCVVQFTPTGTITYGTNDIGTPIEPGQSVILEVVTGNIDGRVIDCDGAILIEDSSGFEFSESIVVTVE